MYLWQTRCFSHYTTALVASNKQTNHVPSFLEYNPSLLFTFGSSPHSSIHAVPRANPFSITVRFALPLSTTTSEQHTTLHLLYLITLTKSSLVPIFSISVCYHSLLLCPTHSNFFVEEIKHF